jgi:GTP pyrophosphokinase
MDGTSVAAYYEPVPPEQPRAAPPSPEPRRLPVAAPVPPPTDHPILKHPVIETLAETLRAKDQPDATADTIRQVYLSAYASPTVEALIGYLHQYAPTLEGDLLRRAYALASIAHAGQYRQSGEPYIDHPVAVATILLGLSLDAESVAAALLHDVVEDSGVGLDLIEAEFGESLAHLVDGVTKLSTLETKSKEELQAGSYRKLIIATADDPRVILIKLADRLHNMRTLGATSPAKQKRIARETLDIYAPLAHRLGMWQVKSELEDLAFKALYPERYEEIANQLTLRKEVRERVIQRMIKRLQEEIDKEGIRARVSGRPKHIYSIWRKMDRKGLPLDQIYDQLAVRVIIDDTGLDEKEAKGLCYRVLGLVHTMWTPVLTEFDDYIAVPKESSYQSLHTTVILPGGNHCEVQIRSVSMHEVAEHGIAAHWRYKEGFGRPSSDQKYEEKIRWLRELIAWRIELSDRDFVESLRPELEEQVYVFTPKGKIIDLPDGSTPVDFAYHIHSEVGHKCVGAKVNGRIVPLDYHLKNGEIVDIMTTKTTRGPSRDWLNFVKTPSARNHIRRYFRRAEREENITAGRDLLEKELKRLGLTVSFESLADQAGARTTEDLFALIGAGEVTARTLAQKVLAQQVEAQHAEAPPEPLPMPTTVQPRTVGIQINGVGAIHNRLARCCNPVVGEPIVGYVTRGRGVTVHRADCRTIVNERDRARLVDVTWGSQAPRGYSVPLRIESWDRVGLWRDVSAVIADAGVNIERIEQGKSRRAGRAVLHVVCSIQSVSQLTNLLDKLNRISDVIEARRESEARRAI